MKNKKWKRVLALVLSGLMVYSVIDFSGFIQARADGAADKSIISVAGIESNIANQELMIGASERDIVFPDTLAAQVTTTTEDVSGNQTVLEETEQVLVDWKLDASNSSHQYFYAEVGGDFYTYVPTFKSGYVLAQGVDTPTITVTIQEEIEETVEVEAPQKLAAPMDEEIPAQGAGTTTLFDGTTITLSSLEFKVGYYDDKHEWQSITVTESNTDAVEVPDDATVSMYFNYGIGNGNSVEVGHEYYYIMPTSVKLTLKSATTLPLNDENNISIGDVTINPDGTLVFVFNDKVKDASNTTFYVGLEGGLSKELSADENEDLISFPTASGTFDFKLDVEESDDDDDDGTHKEIFSNKSGTVINGSDGKKYIEWTVSVGYSGMDSFSGTITDNLPTGLTYKEMAGYPKVTGRSYGNDGTVTPTVAPDKRSVVFDVDNLKVDYRGNITFLTEYDTSGLAGVIDENSKLTYDNTVLVESDDDEVEDKDPKGSIDIKPDLLTKNGTAQGDGYIHWVVTVNKEGLDIAGATFTDTYATLTNGFKIENASDVVIKGADGLPTSTGVSITGLSNDDTDGFTVTFSPVDGGKNKNYYTIEYKTLITDVDKADYDNTAKLTKPGVYNYKVDSTVPGLNLLGKTCTNYNKLTNTFTWNVTLNASGIDMGVAPVTVEDYFNDLSDNIEFVGAKMDGVSLTPTAIDTTNIDGKTHVTFSIPGIGTNTKNIQITTKIVDPTLIDPSAWTEFRNDVDLHFGGNTITKHASKFVQVTKPDLIYKDGKAQGDGTILWTVRVYAPIDNATVEAQEFYDKIPTDMEYVPGSFRLQNPYEWNEANKVYVDPIIGTAGGQQTITFTPSKTDPKQAQFFSKEYEIIYLTKVTDKDAALDDSHTYTNSAKYTVEYPDNIIIDDTDSKTVTGKVGGVVDKKGVRKDSVVTWTVQINEAGLDLSGISNPTIEDELASYFTYQTGTLYKVTGSGDVEVPKTSYVAAVVNNKLTVQLPEIGTDTYKFVFSTIFNVEWQQLPKGGISNSVNFKGSGVNKSVVSNTLDNVTYSLVVAGAHTNKEIRVKKVAAGSGTPLSGAKFQLKVGNLILGEKTTDASGFAVFDVSTLDDGYTIKLVEVEAPDGYVKLDTPETWQYNISELLDDNGVKYKLFTITNEPETVPVLGGLKLVKVDAVNDAKLENVTFGIYSDVACTDANLISSRKTDEYGFIEMTSLADGTYYIKEISSIPGYKLGTKLYRANVVGATTTYDVSSDNGGSWSAATLDGTAVKISNDAIKATLRVKKTDSKDVAITGAGKQATFGLYSDSHCEDLISSQLTSVTTGIAEFTNLTPGVTYYYREDAAPTGYVLDSTIHSITIGTGLETVDVSEDVEVSDDEAIGDIVITKIGDDAAATVLSGVEFGLYTDSACTVAYQVGLPLTNLTATTNAYGKAYFRNIPFGTYWVKELTGATGYDISSPVTEIVVNKTGNTNQTIVNKRIKADVKVTKEDAADATKKLSGAVFGLFRNSGLRVATGTTDASGEVTFEDVVYDTDGYYIQEITPPTGYLLNTTKYPVSAADINTAYSTHVTIDKTVTDTRQNGKILAFKYDAASLTTGLSGAVFTLYDEHNIALKTATSMTALQAAASGVPGAVLGSVYFDELPYGTYYLKETTAPEDYIRSATVYKIVVNSETIVTTGYADDSASAGALNVANEKVINPIISFKFAKKDSDTDSALAGATFTLYKKASTDAGFVATTVTAVSDSYGMVYFKRIDLDEYTDTTQFAIKETQIPTGYSVDDEYSYNGVLSDDYIVIGTKQTLKSDPGFVDNLSTPKLDADIQAIDFTIVKDGANTTGSDVKNAPLKGTIEVTKERFASTAKVSGAEFTLYESDGVTPVVLAGLTNPATTGTNGKVTFANLPVGNYVVKETGAPNGYALNAMPQNATILDNTTIPLKFVDQPLTLSVNKYIANTSTFLAGATLQIKEGSTVRAEWTTTNKSQEIDCSNLKINTTYTLEETVVPRGYIAIDPVSFQFTADGTLQIISGATKTGQTIVLYDEPIQLKVAKTDNLATPLSGAILSLIDDTTGIEVERFTSNGSVHTIDSTKLYAPASGYRYYTLLEVSAPNGYEVASNIKIAIDSKGKIYDATTWGGTPNPATIKADFTITMVDEIKPDDIIYFTKVSSGNGERIAGATLRIYESSDPDTDIVAPWSTTTDNPKAVNVLAWDLSKTYVLEETIVPNGFVKAKQILFQVELDGTKYKIKTLTSTDPKNKVNTAKDTVTINDELIDLKVRKENSFGTLLKNATLQLYMCSDAALDDPIQVGSDIATTSAAASVIRPQDLMVNKYYILKEVSAPNGYLKAEDIVFYMNPDGVVQACKKKSDGTAEFDTSKTIYDNTIVMVDGEIGVGVSKVSLTDSLGLAGAQFKLEAIEYNGVEKDSFFETKNWMSDGTVEGWDIKDFNPGHYYQLTEVLAPTGFAYADPLIFFIDADHNIVLNGSSQTVTDRTILYADGQLELKVDKKSKDTGEGITGAQMAIVNASGEVVSTWTSTGAPFSVDVSRLVAPSTGYAEYAVRELLPPVGYEKAEDIPFAIDRDGKIYSITVEGGVKNYTEITNKTITMLDLQMLAINKVNASGEALEGATLQISSVDDATFTPVSFVTDGTLYYLNSSAIKVGKTYVLSEIHAPNGYALANDISFTVDAQGKVIVDGQMINGKTITMTDKNYKFYVFKQDKKTKKGVKGAKLAILNKAGKQIYAFTSNGKKTSIPVDKFVMPNKGEMSYYTLVEKTAPEGYKVAKKVAFAIDAYGTVYVKAKNGSYVATKDNIIKMFDEKISETEEGNPPTKNTPPGSNTPTPPTTHITKTGDTMPIKTIFGFEILGVAALVLLIRKKKELGGK